MDFKQLEAFIKVVELASFSKAADELYISQSSVSTYVATLEKELGAVLINRSTKMLSVTLMGERFLEKAKMMMALKRESEDMIKNLSGDASGEIRILASTMPAQYILPNFFTHFQKSYPDIVFSMSQGDTTEVVQGIAAQKADIGFAGSIIMNKACEYIEFADERLVFIVPNDGSYSENKKYSIEELLYSNNFISREHGSGTRIQYEKYFEERGINLDKINICATMDSTYCVINSVVSGLGISIVSEIAARQAIKSKLLMQISLIDELPTRKIYTVLNKKIIRSHLVNLFMEKIKEFEV